MFNRRLPRADFPASGYLPNPALKRDAPQAARPLAPRYPFQ